MWTGGSPPALSPTTIRCPRAYSRPHPWPAKTAGRSPIPTMNSFGGHRTRRRRRRGTQLSARAGTLATGSRSIAVCRATMTFRCQTMCSCLGRRRRPATNRWSRRAATGPLHPATAASHRRWRPRTSPISSCRTSTRRSSPRPIRRLQYLRPKYAAYLPSCRRRPRLESSCPRWRRSARDRPAAPGRAAGRATGDRGPLPLAAPTYHAARDRSHSRRAAGHAARDRRRSGSVAARRRRRADASADTSS